MKKRFLRELTLDPEGVLPDNVVQVVNISRRYLVGRKNGKEIYGLKFYAVVEEDVEP